MIKELIKWNTLAEKVLSIGIIIVCIGILSGLVSTPVATGITIVGAVIILVSFGLELYNYSKKE